MHQNYLSNKLNLIILALKFQVVIFKVFSILETKMIQKYY